VIDNAYVIDALSRKLDPTSRHLQNWKHLAHLNDVSADLAQERHSRSEEMFKVLAASNPSLSIGTLRRHLENLQINTVRDYIARLDGRSCIYMLP